VRAILQDLLAGLYGLVRRTGVFSKPAGRWAFERAYGLYKDFIEAGPVDRLREYVPANACVLDVGANIGWFAVRLGRWVGSGGRVIALEPEPLNFRRLQAAVCRAGLSAVVECVNAAAAEQPGILHLALNPDNPADHRLAEDGIAVDTVTLDGLMEARGWPAVAFIKIDVQGAEARVLAGAAETLRRFRPALFLEVDADPARVPPGTAEALLERLASLGYAPHRLRRQGPMPVLSPAEAAAAAREAGYCDFLFLAAT
jgi:FkbM family methyltransferase